MPYLTRIPGNYPFIMKKTLKCFLIAILSITLIVILICFPQLYYFDNKLVYKNFTIYSNIPFPSNTPLILDNVEKLIQKSEIYDSDLHFKIFLRSDYNIHRLLPWQFSDSAYAITRPLIRNIFISKGDFQTNSAYKISGGKNSLDKIIAHEIVHILIENKFLGQSRIFAKDRSKLGFFWKEEGYADYIAARSTSNFFQESKNKNNFKSSVYGSEYFNYSSAIKYLIDKKHMRLNEILRTEISLDDVLKNSKQHR